MMRIVMLIGTYVDGSGLGTVLCGDPGVVLGRNPDRVRAPDVCFVSSARMAINATPAGFLALVPDFIVEIVSPGDRAGEVQAKTQEWLDAGAELVWVVYPESQSVLAFRGRSEVRSYAYEETIDAAPVLPGFSVPVAELFA